MEALLQKLRNKVGLLFLFKNCFVDNQTEMWTSLCALKVKRLNCIYSLRASLTQADMRKTDDV